MATDTSKQCTITNNSGKDVVLMLAVPENETFTGGASLNAAGTMEVLKTSEGNTVIKSGSSGTVTLNHSYKAAGVSNGYVKAYDLVAADKDWLYPLASIPVAQDGAGYAAQTVTTESGTAVNKAIDFYQTIAVYPNSQLAKDYIAALTAAKEEALAKADGSADSAAAAGEVLNEKLTAFFQSTEDYKTVTLADVAAIEAYYKNVPCVWAQYKDSTTYYLYGSDGKTAGFQGTLSLQKTGPVDISKGSGGFTCLFTPAATPADKASTEVVADKAVNLTYANGLFVDDVASDTPAITLKGSFMLKRFFSAEPEDNSVIIIMAGQVSGMPCIGFDVPQRTSDAPPQVTATQTTTSSIEKFWYQLTHPKTQGEMIAAIFSLIGAIALIPISAAIVYALYKGLKYKAMAKEAIARKNLEDDIDALNGRMQEDNPKVFSDAVAPAPPFEFRSLTLAEDYATNYGYASQLAGAFTFQENVIRSVLKFSPLLDGAAITNLETALNYIVKYDSNLNANPGNAEYLNEFLPQAHQNFQQFQQDINAAFTKVQTKMSKDLVEDISESLKFGQVILDNLENTNEEYNEDSENVSPKAEEIIKMFEK